MAFDVVVPRAFGGSATGSTLALQTMEIYLAKSPGAPKQANNRGVENVDWSLFLGGALLVASGTTGPDGMMSALVIPGLPYTLNALGTNYEITLRTDPLEPLTDFTGQQRRLGMLGYHLGRTGPDGNGVDGVMGPKTDRAIQEFQSDQGKKADGNVGPITRGALKGSVGE
jgi:peptidoglycan hydrolase-like protein with peptidoglycan-binding domain